jgi:hypothetical protein
MKANGRLLALAVVAPLLAFLVPMIPESIPTTVARCNDPHRGCVTGPSSLSVTASAGYRLFTLGVVKADVPCQSGIVNETDTYVSFGSTCGETYSWQW